MFNVVTIILACICLGVIVLALAVFLKDHKAALNKFFFAFNIGLVCWILANYLSNSVALTPKQSLIANHSVLFFADVSVMFVALFSVHLTKYSRKFSRILWATGLAGGVLALSTAVVQSVVIQQDVVAIKFGPLSIIYVAAILILVGITLFSLLKGIYKAKGEERNRVKAVFFSLAFSLVLLVISNLILPTFFNQFGLTNVAPISVLLVVAGLYYTVAKHHLFNIKLIIARAVGYLLTLLVIFLLYFVLTFMFSSLISRTGAVISRLLNTVFILIVIFSYQRFKKFFDRVTNRLFYQDAYDPQVFLDKLNTVLVSTIELDKLLTDTLTVMGSNLKTSFLMFSLRETSYFSRRDIGDSDRRFTEEDINLINATTPYIHKKVIVSEYLEDHTDLKKVLEKNDVAVLVRLVSTLDFEVEGIGYIMLGIKKSGSPYSKLDLRMLDIIANELVIAIQNGLRFEEIEKFNATLQEKIDNATKSLQRSNDKLRTLDETKDEFISMASHQLRTPLTSVKGYLSMVLEGDAGEITEMQHKLLDQAYTSSQRMVYLIADLLNVSRLRTGKFVIEPIATNLAGVVEGEIGQLRETAKARKLSLAYDKPATFPTLMLDETKIRQVIMNFIDNAIYYTPAGGHIQVELKETDKTIEYTVTDEGIGVPKSERHHLFTKFYRAANAKKARPDGTGLGLFMAKKVIVAQGGTLIFQSEEGKGSTFGFSFEKAKILPNPATP